MSVLLKHSDYIRRTDCFICNEMEFGRFFDMDTAFFTPAQMLSFVKEQTALHSYPSTIVTMGDRGCVFLDRKTGEEGWIPAISTKVVDTTGAGDIFGGSAVWKLLQQKAPEMLNEEEVRSITEFAGASAGLSTTKPGGISSVPTLEQVLERLGK